MRLWIVGKPAASDNSPRNAWEFQGVFDTRAQAMRACVGPDHFMFPATLNERLSEETVASAGTVFPNRPDASPLSQKKPR
ncbi:MAG: hypothetical protein ACT4QC_16285 [Planctomycetaceae bacterium]